MKSHFTFRVEESEELSKTKQSVPVGRKQFIRIIALEDGVEAGRIVINISKLHSTSPPRVGIILHQGPQKRLTHFLEMARDLLTRTIIELNKRQIYRADFLLRKHQYLSRVLTENSGLFKKRFGNCYYFDTRGYPIVKQSAFAIERRKIIQLMSRVKEKRRRPVAEKPKQVIVTHKLK